MAIIYFDDLIPLQHDTGEGDLYNLFEFEVETRLMNHLRYMADTTGFKAECYEPFEVIIDFIILQIAMNDWTRN